MTITLDSRRTVGRTTLQLPPLGLGTAHIGEMYAVVEEADSAAMLNAAWDAGIRFYDTAPWYGRGLSEHRLGGMLRTRPRNEFQITTKVGRTLHRPKDFASFSRAPWKGGLNFEVNYDYSYDGIMRSYEQALQRLALDTVEALVIHDLDRPYHPGPGDYDRYVAQLKGSGMKALAELKASGDIKAFGMGINTEDALEELASSLDLDFTLVAMPYTLANQKTLHTGMADCVRRNVSVIIGAPFASGILVKGASNNPKYNYQDAPADIVERVRGIEAVCKAHGVSLPSAALQFVLAHPAVVSAIPGAVKPQEVIENVASLQAPIPASFWSDLKTQKLIDPDSPVPGDTARG